MNRNTKIALGVAGALALVGIGVAATRKGSGATTLPPREGGDDPTPLEPTAPPPVAPSGSEVLPGWHTVGWYSYTGPADHKMWIRVDAGPTTEGLVFDSKPWMWLVIEGNTQIAQGTVQDVLDSDIGPTLFDFLGHDDLIAQLVARYGADQIDAMYGPTPGELEDNA